MSRSSSDWQQPVCGGWIGSQEQKQEKGGEVSKKSLNVARNSACREQCRLFGHLTVELISVDRIAVVQPNQSFWDFCKADDGTTEKCLQGLKRRLGTTSPLPIVGFKALYTW